MGVNLNLASATISAPPEPPILSPRELRKAVGLSRSTIDRLEAAGLFPKRRRIGLRRVFWYRSEIENWIASRPFVKQEGDHDKN